MSARSVLAMERSGFEVRDVETLREHYATTLRSWVSNLEANWDDAVRVAGLARGRIWRLYMAGSAIAFTDGKIAVHQLLGVVPTEGGRSGMPSTRRVFEAKPGTPRHDSWCRRGDGGLVPQPHALPLLVSSLSLHDSSGLRRPATAASEVLVSTSNRESRCGRRTR